MGLHWHRLALALSCDAALLGYVVLAAILHELHDSRAWSGVFGLHAMHVIIVALGTLITCSSGAVGMRWPACALYGLGMAAAMFDALAVVGHVNVLLARDDDEHIIGTQLVYSVLSALLGCSAVLVSRAANMHMLAIDAALFASDVC